MSTLESAIALFRRTHVRQFRAEGVVKRVTAEGAFNPATGRHDDPTEETIYEGPCNVREVTWQGTDAQTGQREVRFQRVELRFPHDTAIREDDIFTATAAVHDASLVGQPYRITDVFLDAWQIVRRAMGEKVTGGSEEA